MSLVGKVHIKHLYNSEHVFGKISSTPDLESGQIALVVSDGTIPDTTDGKIYLIPHNGTPVDIIGDFTISYEDIATSSAVHPDKDVVVSDFDLNTGSDIALTLSDPSAPVLGNTRKQIIISRFTTGSSLTLNIDSFVGGSGISYTAVGQSTDLIWSAGGWAIIGGAGGTVF